MIAEIIETRIDYCEQNVKTVAAQQNDLIKMLHQNELNITSIKAVQQTNTDDIRRLRHDMKSLDEGFDMNFKSLSKDVQVLKDELLGQKAQAKAKKSILDNWRTVLLVVISVGSFLLSIVGLVIDWWLKKNGLK